MAAVTEAVTEVAAEVAAVAVVEVEAVAAVVEPTSYSSNPELSPPS